MDQAYYHGWPQNNSRSWVLSEGYAKFWGREIARLLHLQRADVVCDIGAGNGIISRMVHREADLDTPILCVEPSAAGEGIENDNETQRLEASAESFFRTLKEDRLFDKLILKQVVHHITGISKPVFARMMKRHLVPGGRGVILTMPATIQYPMFKAARDHFAKTQVNRAELVDALRESGLMVEESVVPYPVKLLKEDFYENIRSRFIGTLSKFSDEEIDEGIDEIDRDYGSPDVYVFNDTLNAVVFINPEKKLVAFADSAPLRSGW